MTIKRKEKPCKGTGLAKGYGCGKPFLKRTLGLCNTCYAKWLFNAPEAKNRKESFVISNHNKVDKEKKKESREKKEKMKSIAALINEARVPFQAWIRFRDANDGCISCGTTTANMYHAGHYKKAELFRGTILDEMNVNKQCAKCNVYLGGNESEYRIGLVEKYGEQAVKDLEERADRLRAYPWTREEIIAIKKKYQKKLRDETV